MPRKAKRKAPESESALREPAKPIQLDAPEVPEKRRGPGRPSKAEVEAREAALREANAMKPEQTLQLTVLLLNGISMGVKGDKPTKEEIELVNMPLCEVINKYGIATRPEVTLGLSVVYVGVMMRQRGASKRKQETQKEADADARRSGNARRKAGEPSNPGTQGVGEIQSVEAIVSAGAQGNRH